MIFNCVLGTKFFKNYKVVNSCCINTLNDSNLSVIKLYGKKLLFFVSY